jgi:hypothetical protein
LVLFQDQITEVLPEPVNIKQRISDGVLSLRFVPKLEDKIVPGQSKGFDLLLFKQIDDIGI